MWSSRAVVPKSAFRRETLYQDLMFAGCVLFGIAMIANTQPAGDGGWFWYARLFLGGKHLYSGMHLALQPLFVLETAGWMTVLGQGWLASKIPAVLQLIAYCYGLLLLARRAELPDRRRAIVLGFAFFLTICFVAYRFDDYHVLSDCFEVYSLILLLHLQKLPDLRRRLAIAALLGVLCGLAITTRLNDGAALLVGVFIAILCLAPADRALSILVVACSAGLTARVVVALTGDTLHDYLTYSIFRAAGSKGGASNVLMYPLELPLNAVRWLTQYWYEPLIGFILGAPLVWVFLLRPAAWQGRGGVKKPALGLAVLILLGVLPRGQIYRPFLAASEVPYLAAFAVIAAYGLGIYVFVAFLQSQLVPGRVVDWDRRQVLALIPLGQLASAAMSSGGWHSGLYGPLAVLFVVLAVALPGPLRGERSQSYVCAVAFLVICSAAAYKYRVPFSWHSYKAARMFVGRQWYVHPNYGPMLIDREQLALMTTVCTDIGQGGAKSELLSLPLPYANYFCSIAPWHDYVQTFFDTSSKATILGLVDELQKDPPEWIFYQRQLANLAVHEKIYNGGAPLPQRDLDALIEQRLSSGNWQAVSMSAYEDDAKLDNHWILIRTQAEGPGALRLEAR